MTDRDITIDDLEAAIIAGEELSRDNYAFWSSCQSHYEEDEGYGGGIQEFRTSQLAPFCRVLSSAWDYASDLLGDEATEHLGAFDAEFVPYMMSIFHDVLKDPYANTGDQHQANLAACEMASAGIEHREPDFSFLED